MSESVTPQRKVLRVTLLLRKTGSSLPNELSISPAICRDSWFSRKSKHPCMVALQWPIATDFESDHTRFDIESYNANPDEYPRFNDGKSTVNNNPITHQEFVCSVFKVLQTSFLKGAVSIFPHCPK